MYSITRYIFFFLTSGSECIFKILLRREKGRRKEHFSFFHVLEFDRSKRKRYTYARRTVSTSLYRYFEQAVTRKRPIFYIDCYIFSDIPRLSVTKHWQFDDYLTFNHRLATRDPIFHFKIFLEEKKRVTRLHELGHFSLSISLIDRKSFNVKEDPFDMREFAIRENIFNRVHDRLPVLHFLLRGPFSSGLGPRRAQRWM